LLFHRELEPDAPEAYEVLRFQEVAKKIGIDLQVLQPRHFDLLVDSTDNWSTMYQVKKLDKPDLIIPRTGSETSYFTILGKFPVDVDLVEREFGIPVVVKTLKGTRGEGVLLCSNREQFNDLASLLDGAKPGADFTFQQYIAESHGRDVRVLVIDGKAVAAMERRSADGGLKANISLGGVASLWRRLTRSLAALLGPPQPHSADP